VRCFPVLFWITSWPIDSIAERRRIKKGGNLSENAVG
jgi:hypothetical protein